VPLSWSGDVTRLARALAGEAGESGAWFWLDGSGDESWSYLGIADEVVTAEAGRSGEFLERLRERGAAEACGAGERSPGFDAGWVVALGYEFGVTLMGLDAAVDTEAPAFALRADAVLAIDHARGTAELRGRSAEAVEARLARYGALLESADPPPRVQSGPRRGALPAHREEAPGAGARWRRGSARYRRDVEACRASISEGEAYVLCLTDTAEVRGAPDPLTVYLRLREDRPALRGGVIAAGRRALASASPERFLGVHGGRLSTHPVKGTRPRGGTPGPDDALADELRSDPKERAENLMIVDLMRNDLSRVCEPGTVAVTGFLRVETHPHVHQLVSTIEGDLRPGLGALDAIAACFPGGSMTGAPKRRAVQLLAELEAAPRGLYSGCFGWIDSGGGAELAMTIRSVELRADGGALVGAGGGVTIDSDPAREDEEKLLKARPLVGALLAAR